MKNWINNTDFLREIPLPTATKSYAPVPHTVFLDEIKEELYKNNYRIKEERYLSANNGLIMTGNYMIEGEDSIISPSIYFTNSYNKMRKAELSSGVMVLVCKNGMISMDSTNRFSRKHSGTVLEDLRSNIKLSVNSIEREFEKLKINMKEMQQIELTPTQTAQIIGDMYINENLIKETQLSILKNEVKFSKDFTTNTAWDLYNHCTEAFKDNHPLEYDRQHIKLHSYMSDIFSLTGSRNLFKKNFKIEIQHQIEPAFSLGESVLV
jgi:hypothetical protein